MSVPPAWIRSYDRGWLRPDLLAGLVVWSVVLADARRRRHDPGLTERVPLAPTVDAAIDNRPEAAP